uniref:telomere repeat-binding protein 3-like n=1 Tax=Erigeron canadensis TaxID=72917 RepID=UPI001CB89BF2|nr:telomere repeat-binding protein 3-like [Erigeron canadensis]
MVLKKRIYYGGFRDLLPPVIPKAPRSLRRRSLHNKSSGGGEICAFELLAAVAGQLLQESESSTSSTNIPKEGVNHEPLEVKAEPIRSEHHDQESGVESELAAQPTNVGTPVNELTQSENDSGSEHASVLTSSHFVKETDNSLRIVAFEDKNGVNENLIKSGRGFSSLGNLHDVIYSDNRSEIHAERIEKQSRGLSRVPNKSSSNVHLSFYRDAVSGACFPTHRGNVNISFRDDDEKYFRYINRNSRRRAMGSRSRGGYRRARKMMASRYWKAAPKMKDYEHTNSIISGGVRSFYHKRKNIYMREWCQANDASKRRKVFHQNSKSAYIKDASSESITNSVKFSIKSFTVPELYVEAPETATVGSLKRRVMEAVTAILQGQLHVGVLLQGKKVRDDNITLEQTGISQNCNLETLEFTLEPSFPEVSPTLVNKATPLLLPRSPSPIIDPCLSNSSPDPPSPAFTLDNHLEKNQESITFSAEVTTEEHVADSKALVVAPPLDAEILAVVPLSEKPIKRHELSQRRIRRPFSVSEVEALVEAVETLGAGRWRDVKMRAFDDANHRTYVDLKDKWKTLVHTASIAPQQRRGEPVPQNLLDRVLAAHAYWSEHQSKQQHVKIQKTLEAPM